MPRAIGNFAEIAMMAEEATPHPPQDTDEASLTPQFRAVSQLIAEGLHFIKVAAGQASDIHHADRLRRARGQQGADASAGSRPGDPDPWARYGANARRQRAAPRCVQSCAWTSAAAPEDHRLLQLPVAMEMSHWSRACVESLFRVSANSRQCHANLSTARFLGPHRVRSVALA